MSWVISVLRNELCHLIDHPHHHQLHYAHPMMKPKDRGGSHLEADKIAPFSHWHWLASHLVFIIMIITVIMKMMKKL